MRRIAGVVGALAMLLSPESAKAQAWPSQPIRFIQGFQAGGNPDTVARLIAQPMSELLGQPVVVEGRIGGGGVLAAEVVAKSKPDGYTIWLAPAGFAASASLHRALPYDPRRDFQFVSMILAFPYVVAGRPDGSFPTIQAMMAAGRAQPGKLNYATGGVGTGIHLTMELLLARADVRMEHVPYRGGGGPSQALINREVDLLVDTPTPIAGLVASGQVKPLVITTGSRWSRWPDVPTVSEALVPGFEVRGWLGVGMPAGVPAPILARLNEAMRAAAARPDVAEKLLQFGTEVWTTTPDEAQRFVAAELDRWADVAAKANIPKFD